MCTTLESYTPNVEDWWNFCEGNQPVIINQHKHSSHFNDACTMPTICEAIAQMFMIKWKCGMSLMCYKSTVFWVALSPFMIRKQCGMWSIWIQYREILKRTSRRTSKSIMFRSKPRQEHQRPVSQTQSNKSWSIVTSTTYSAESKSSGRDIHCSAKAVLKASELPNIWWEAYKKRIRKINRKFLSHTIYKTLLSIKIFRF